MKSVDWAARFGTLVHDVARMYSRRFDEIARAEVLLTRAQARVLVTLYRYGATSQVELAERLELTPMALAQLLDRMEGKELLRRVAHATDRRIHELQLTPMGVAQIRPILKVSDGVELEALDGLSDAERVEFLRMLRIALANLAARGATSDGRDAAHDGTGRRSTRTALARKV
jgi:MarR family transcriptional regulator, transcriptional regulator for hemolysin